MKWFVNLINVLKHFSEKEGASVKVHPPSKRAGSVSEESVSKGFEVTEIDTFWVFFGAASFIIVAIILFLILVPYFQNLKRHFVSTQGGKIPPSFSQERVIAEGPRLQVDEARDLQNYLEKERKLLSTYGWIDSQREIVHIPIDRAVDLLTHSKELK